MEMTAGACRPYSSRIFNFNQECGNKISCEGEVEIFLFEIYLTSVI